MKYCFLLLLNILGALLLNAQQRPYYTQYILNNYIINPAVAGIENYTDVKLSHRHQWVGLTDAPVTTYFTIHGSLKRDDYGRETATTVHAPGSNPRGEAYWRDYIAPAPHHGIGFTAINDVTGPISRFAAMATYAYHLSLNAQTNLSFGVSAGISQMRLNTEKLVFYQQNDPSAFGNGQLNTTKPDISVGLWLYGKDYFIGASLQQIISQNLIFSNNTVVSKDSIGRLIPHIFLQAGYRMMLSEDVSFLPSLMVRYIKPLKPGFDVNAKVQYRDLLWVGANYRHEDGFAGMLG
ncbi:MAG: type IX secretion system membrane protein PorP/SprF, partial [Chitinophagaceae bacterium]